MSKNRKIWKMLFPAIGVIFGCGIGMIVSILCLFNMAEGMIVGAIIGLIIGPSI